LLPTFGTASLFGYFQILQYFYCPETKSSNTNEVEKERYLALADTFKPTGIKNHKNKTCSYQLLLWTLCG
jgi:hypothetical protein